MGKEGRVLYCCCTDETQEMLLQLSTSLYALISTLKYNEGKAVTFYI